MKLNHLIHSIREGIGDEGGDLVHEIVSPAGVQDPGESAHLHIRPGFSGLLEPVIHDPALPGIIGRVGRGHRGVEQPPAILNPIGRRGAGERTAAAAGEAGGEEGGGGGDDGVVGDESHGEGDEEVVGKSTATNHLRKL